MTNTHRRYGFVTVRVWCEATGDKPDTVRRLIRRSEIAARDLNAGTGRRPRWRIYGRELRKRLSSLPGSPPAPAPVVPPSGGSHPTDTAAAGHSDFRPAAAVRGTEVRP